MSYIRRSDSTSPAIKAQSFTSSVSNGDLAVTLDAPQCIGNPTDTAGYITFMLQGDTVALRDYFLPGQFKPFAVKTVYGANGGTSTLTGSTINCYVAGA
jgi:hypothetical protein